jgi:hypothetical protein
MRVTGRVYEMRRTAVVARVPVVERARTDEQGTISPVVERARNERDETL